jgi:hypothetical protein
MKPTKPSNQPNFVLEKITKRWKHFLLLPILYFFLNPLYASHVIGGELSYQYLSTSGTSSTYRIKLTYYRDCGGIAISTSPVFINIRNASITTSATVTYLGVVDRSLLCPGQVSRCASPTSTIPGVEEYTWQGQVTLPHSTSPYTMWVSLCCRPAGITNLVSSSSYEQYLSTLLLNDGILNNSSPSFLSPPSSRFCVGQASSLSLNGFDADGDVLQYSLVPARRGTTFTPINMTYNAGFSGTQPFNASGLNINPTTGVLSFTPTTPSQRAVVAIKAEEFRNGVKIGEIIREFEVLTINCGANVAPSIAPLPNVVVNVGDTYCVPIISTDPNNDNILLTATSGLIPPATFVVNSTTPGTTNATFCFTASAAQAGNSYAVTINANDRSCPVPVGAARTFNIVVPIPCNVSIAASTTASDCGQSNGTATASLSGGVLPYSYIWSGPSGFNSNASSPIGLAAGVYTISISDGNNCESNTTVVVSGSNSNISPIVLTNYATCESNGSIIVNGDAGTAPYLYSFNGSAFTSTTDYNNLVAGIYTIVVQDALGCSVTVTTNLLNIGDNQAPSITCNSFILNLDEFGMSALMPSDVASASDLCGAVTLSLNNYTFNCALLIIPPVPQNVVAIATDAAGNTATCVAQVVVQDSDAPEVECLNATVQLTNTLTSVSGADLVSLTLDHAHEACTIIDYFTIPNSLSCANLGINNVTLFVTDNSGNTGFCTAQVTVTDAAAPVPNNLILADLVGECEVKATPPSALDNCAGTILGTTTDATTYTTQGTYTITWSYDDGNGNVNTQSQVVIIDDITAPVADISALPTINGECSSSANAPTATDNCAGIIVGTTTDPTNYTTQGTYTITWSYDDGNGNVSTQSQEVIVDDVTAPVADISTLPTINGECSASATAPTATDTCAGIIVGTTTDPTSYSAQGTYTITWSYDDGNGNVSTQTQEVIVDDITAPVADISALPTINGECSASATAPTATDNCAGVIVGTTTDPISYSAQGTYTITWSYDDGNGNISAQSQEVIVFDMTPPIAVCNNYTLNLINGVGNITAADIGAASTDNCGIQSMTVAPSTFTCADAGVQSVQLNVIDSRFNSSSCYATVTVLAQATCAITATPSNTTFTGGIPTNIYLGYGPQSLILSANASGATSFTYSWLPATNLSCANCANPIFNNTVPGNYSYTLTTTNNNGCSTTCTIQICVVDARATGKGNNGKVLLCHVPSGNSGNAQTLSISPNAVPAHLSGHAGDKLGTCGASCTNAARISLEEGQLVENEIFETIVYPNPTKNEFTVTVSSLSKTPITASLYDLMGRKVFDLDGITNNIPYTLNMPLADGIYLIKVMQNGHIENIRLIKGD